eukprot:1739147-Rhodomonas_salina.1
MDETGVPGLSSFRPKEGIIDGSTVQDFMALPYDQCYNTPDYVPEQWVMIDLTLTRSIERFMLWVRGDCCADKMNNFKVWVGSAESCGDFAQAVQCYTHGTAQDGEIVDAPCVAEGQYVFVSVINAHLAFCEFKVYGPSSCSLTTPALVQCAATTSTTSQTTTGLGPMTTT